MTNWREPLTPAEQMRRIREAVEAGGSERAWDARAELVAIVLQLEILQERLTNLEQRGSVQTGSFTAPPAKKRFLSAPVHAIWNWLSRRRSAQHLANRLRAVWNWAALNSFLPAMAVQQNQFNAETIQLLRGVLDALDSMSRLVQEAYREVARLEAQVGSHRAQDPPGSCTSQ